MPLLSCLFDEMGEHDFVIIANNVQDSWEDILDGRWPNLWRTMNNYVSRTSFVQVKVVAMTGRGIHHKMMFGGLCRIQSQFSPLWSILEQMINSSVWLSASSTVWGTLVDWMRHLELWVLIQNHMQTELSHRLSSSHWGHQRSVQNTPAV